MMKVKANKRFLSVVFGADDFLKNFPEISTTGIDLKKIGDYYYVMKNAKPVHDSAFFSQEELDIGLQII